MDKFIKPIVLSIKSPLFLAASSESSALSMKWAVFMDEPSESFPLSMKMPVFMDRESAKGLEPFQSV